MGMGKGLLDSLIAEGGVKSRDLNAAKFYGYPYFTFDLEEIFCTYLCD